VNQGIVMNAQLYFLQGMIKIVLASIFFLVAALILVYLPEATAQDQVEKINCQAPGTSYTLIINKNHVSLYKEDNFAHQRSVASTMPVNTTKTVNGFTKTLDFENKRYTIHIENQNKFSDVSDYLSIRSSEGHEMTYPLICQ
jgi:hypothetical protein